MTKRDLIPLTSYDREPEGMTEDEAHEFWSTHAITAEYLASAPPVPADALPPIGSPRTYRAIYLKRASFDRLRKLARRRGSRVDDLIDMLVTQAIAAEDEATRVTASERR
jgi:hypothetical protein